MPQRLDAIALVERIDATTDRRDWDGLRACYTDEVYYDNESLSGVPPTSVPAERLVAVRQRRAEEGGIVSVHMRTTFEVDVAGDEATVRSTCYGINITPAATGDTLWEVWSSWEHGLVWSPTGWKCNRQAMKMIASRGAMPMPVDGPN